MGWGAGVLRRKASRDRVPPRRGGRVRARRRRAPRAAPQTILPWYLIVLGVAVAASTSAAQKSAVARLSRDEVEDVDPMPSVTPHWIKESRRARRFWTLFNRVITRMGQDNLTLVAAGVAFYAMFSIFPALGALVSVYGLFGDTHVVQQQVQEITVLLPPETAKLLNSSLSAFLSKPNANLNFGLLVSLSIAIFAARNGCYSLMTGLNIALERPEQRSLLTQNLVAIGLTVGAIVFAIVALTIVAVIPIVIALLPLDDHTRGILAYSRWPVLAVFILVSLDTIYRFGPSSANPRWHLISTGTLFAAGLWILGSFAFSQYVTRFGSYDTTYGSLGAAIVLLLWFWLSALIVLLGAAIDSVRSDMRIRAMG